MKAATVSGPSLLDHRLEALGHAGRELLLALARLAEAVVLRALSVCRILAIGRSKSLWFSGRPGQRGRGHGDAVIAAVAGDDLLLLRPAERVVVEPDHLDDGIVGLRAGVAEEDLGHRHRRDGDQLLRQLDGHVGDLLGEGVVVGQLAHLAVRRLDQPLLAVAQRQAPEPRQALQIGLAVLVIDIDALAAGQHQRAFGLVLLGIGVGMQVKGDVAGGGGIAAKGHFILIRLGARCSVLLMARGKILGVIIPAGRSKVKGAPVGPALPRKHGQARP